MTSARPVIPPTNLKDRIAALEQRNNGSNVAVGSPAVSPSGVAPANGAQSVGALRDKIARFEKKGGVPVPRGSFGLGAPPTADGPRRQGELYGNRIPAPARALSAQYTGSSRASSPIGSVVDYSRRSFSTSIAMGDFDEGSSDYSPMSSPSFGQLPDTPESAAHSPELSPLLADVLAHKRAPARGTAFHEALDFARKTEAAKLLAAARPVTKKSTDTDAGEEKSTGLQPLKSMSDTVDDDDDDGGGDTTAAEVAAENVTQALQESPPDEAKELPSPSEPVPSDVSLSATEPSIVTAEVGSDVVQDDREGPQSAPTSLTSKIPVSRIRKRVSSSKPLVDKSSPTTASANADTTAEVASALPSAPASSEKPLVATRKDELELEKRDAQQPQPDSRSVGAVLTNGDRILAQGSSISRTPTILVNEVAPGKGGTPIGVKSRDSESLASEKSADDNVGAPLDSSTESLPREVGGDRSSNEVRRTPVRPTIQPPDPSSFLSPPPTAYRSARSSSEISSLSSSASDSSRPLSMIETSPGQITRALRMIPATDRGVAIFLPPGRQQSASAHIPPSPDGVLSTAAEQTPGECGDVTFENQRRNSLPDIKAASSTTFKAVVHGKVKEQPVSSLRALNTHFVPATPDKRATLQYPLSPGQGELSALLQESMWLEDTLMSGKLPGESPTKEAAAATKERDEAKAREESKVKGAAPPLRSKRDLPIQGRLKHTFLMPLSKAKAMQKKDASSKIPEPAPHRSREDSSGQQQASNKQQEQVPSGEKAVPRASAPTTPTKLPKPSRFPSFKRFGSISLAPDVVLRQINSTPSEISSSEDSNLVVTPPDNALEFGKLSPTKDDSKHGQDLSFSFPSLSPKKSAGSVGRAASFAGKMWSRARTKSNGSVLSSNSTVTHDELVPQLPVLNHSPNLELPPSTLAPTSSDKGVVPPSRSSSLRHRADVAPTPYTATLQLPAATPQSNAAGSRFLDFNATNEVPSPISISSLPSPLFDKDIFDAFPSVPGTTPTPVGRLVRRGDQGLTVAAATTAAAAAAADFNSTFLASSR